MVMVSAMLGRVHLSGRPDLLTPGRAAVVRRAGDVYKTYRHLLPHAEPHWPLGLPGWRDGWLALALRTDGGPTLPALWRRDGAAESVTGDGRPRVLFEAGRRAELVEDDAGRTLKVTLPAERSAVLIALDPERS
ncbi:hypothetical protein [Streptomyces scabiei]|uniref:hypothetical protein n=1 Tax=Streptomyces scabiei TaxID=1930 RepID=UPI0004E6CD7F|nr:hypothetical protein [Streptomyces scabiei]KFG09328.1 hypothetical protein IQ61_08865 [Streptomyces scabiei]MDX2830306.1 hypothetical protein [Streptomyces scabiei]MDX3676431.1 hypothetical protein [Streptomyces scabiei]